MNINEYKTTLDLLDGAQHNKDVNGWQTLHEFDNSSPNIDFNARVYKQGNRIVISIAGSDLSRIDDWKNDLNIMFSINKNIPSQYGDAERLYLQVKDKYPDAIIESKGYSLGGTLSNLLSHRFGIKSTALAPIGSEHIANNYPDYFKYDGSNITTYGRKGDGLFNITLKRQSGNVNIVPNMPKEHENEMFAQHMLHNYSPYNLYSSQPQQNDSLISNIYKKFNNLSQKIQSRIQPTGRTDDNFSSKTKPLEGHVDYTNIIFQDTENPLIFTREDIGNMSQKDFNRYEKLINRQMETVGIPFKEELPKGTKTWGSEKAKQNYSNEKGRWVTIKGRHVFIEE